MSAADLARIAAAIEQDAATEASSWTLSRERARLYLALGRAVAEWAPGTVDCNRAFGEWSKGDCFTGNYADLCDVCKVQLALAALAPEEVPDAAR